MRRWGIFPLQTLPTNGNEGERFTSKSVHGLETESAADLF